MSFKRMIWMIVNNLLSRNPTGRHTLSCWSCFNSLTSRNMCFAMLSVLNGSQSFFTATVLWLIWSLAELKMTISISDTCDGWNHHTKQVRRYPFPQALYVDICDNDFRNESS